METEVNNEIVEVANDTIDYKALYEEKTNKVNELEWLIQKHKDKKAPKAESKSVNENFSPDVLDNMLNEREFYKNNPWMADYKDQIAEYTSTGKVSLEQAHKLVIDSNPDIVARQNTQNANFTTWTPGFTNSQISREDLENAEWAEYNRLRDLIESGKSTLIK